MKYLLNELDFNAIREDVSDDSGNVDSVKVEKSFERDFRTLFGDAQNMEEFRKNLYSSYVEKVGEY